MKSTSQEWLVLFILLLREWEGRGAMRNYIRD